MATSGGIAEACFQVRVPGLLLPDAVVRQPALPVCLFQMVMANQRLEASLLRLEASVSLPAARAPVCFFERA
jgi:hypothetical protein